MLDVSNSIDLRAGIIAIGLAKKRVAGTVI